MMIKKSYISILIILFGLSCDSNQFESQGYWIGTYSTSNNNSNFLGYNPALLRKHEGELLDTIKLKRVLLFEKDSMVIASFNETQYYGYYERKLNFSTEKDSIKIKTEEDEFKFKYKYENNNTLSINFINDEYRIQKDHFIQADEFEMAHQEYLINSFLINTPVTLGKRTDKIEFLKPSWKHMGEFLQDSLEAIYGYGNDWYFYTLEKELFLSIGNELIHINDFDGQSIHGYTYNKQISKIKITASSYDNSFEVKHLIGQWQNTGDLNNSKNNYKLKISSDKIIITTNSFTDTLQWNLNKYENKILIKNDHYDRNGNYWNIKSISENRLTIKRDTTNRHYTEIETMNLTRIE